MSGLWPWAPGCSRTTPTTRRSRCGSTPTPTAIRSVSSWPAPPELLEQAPGRAQVLAGVDPRLELGRDRRDGPGGGAQAAVGVGAGLEVDPQLGRRLGVV